MTKLTSLQCGKLSRLAAINEGDDQSVQWRVRTEDNKYNLEWRVTYRLYSTPWFKLFMSRNKRTFAGRVHVANTYYKAAREITDMLNAARGKTP